jgi:hypothetical protein
VDVKTGECILRASNRGGVVGYDFGCKQSVATQLSDNVGEDHISLHK